MFRLLVESGADLNVKNLQQHDNDPIHYAVIYNRIQIADLLLERGAKVDQVDDRGFTALHEAARKNRTEIAAGLIKYGANVNFRQASNVNMPLQIAAVRGNIQIVNLLLDNGALVNAKRSRDGYTALHLAAWNGNLNVVVALIKANASLENETNFGETALVLADLRGHRTIVQLLLDHGANPTTTGNEDWTPILRAVKADNHLGLALVLMESTADLERRDKDGKTPLIVAFERGFITAGKLLLDHGADVNVVDNFGGTALSYAVNTDFSDLSLENGEVWQGWLQSYISELEAKTVIGSKTE